jgi:hypothetical protein
MLWGGWFFFLWKFHINMSSKSNLLKRRSIKYALTSTVHRFVIISTYELTSSVFITEIRESPYVSKSYSITNHRQDKFQFPAPCCSWFSVDFRWDIITSVIRAFLTIRLIPRVHLWLWNFFLKNIYNLWKVSCIVFTRHFNRLYVIPWRDHGAFFMTDPNLSTSLT